MGPTDRKENRFGKTGGIENRTSTKNENPKEDHFMGKILPNFPEKMISQNSNSILQWTEQPRRVKMTQDSYFDPKKSFQTILENSRNLAIIKHAVITNHQNLLQTVFITRKQEQELRR